MSLREMLGFKQKVFPEQGTYLNIRYRIDGDSVILKWNNDVELEFRPSADMTQDEFDKLKSSVEAGKSDIFPLSLWDHPVLIEKARQRSYQAKGLPETKIVTRNSYATGNFNETAKLYGWSLEEQHNACDIAGVVMARYWRNRAKLKRGNRK